MSHPLRRSAYGTLKNNLRIVSDANSVFSVKRAVRGEERRPCRACRASSTSSARTRCTGCAGCTRWACRASSTSCAGCSCLPRVARSSTNIAGRALVPGWTCRTSCAGSARSASSANRASGARGSAGGTAGPRGTSSPRWARDVTPVRRVVNT